jgi:hypothetical protein
MSADILLESVPSSSHLKSDTVPAYDVVIPLSPFEKILLDGIDSTYFAPFTLAIDLSREQSAQIGDNGHGNQGITLDEDSRSLELELQQLIDIDQLDNEADSGQISNTSWPQTHVQR